MKQDGKRRLDVCQSPLHPSTKKGHNNLYCTDKQLDTQREMC